MIGCFGGIDYSFYWLAEAELDGETDALVLELAELEGLELADGDVLALLLELAELDGETLAEGLVEAEGDFEEELEAEGERLAEGLLDALGDCEAEELELGDDDALGEALALGETDDDGEILGDALIALRPDGLLTTLASWLSGRQIAIKRSEPAVTDAVPRVRIISSSVTNSVTLELTVTAAGVALHQLK